MAYVANTILPAEVETKIIEEPTSPDRRLAIIEIGSSFLVHMLTDPGLCYSVEDGLIPPDARVKVVRYDLMRDCWEICLESDAFGPVPENMIPPTLPRPVLRVRAGAHEDGS